MPLVSNIAFVAITGSMTLGLQVSYIIPISLRLYNQIVLRNDDELTHGVFRLKRFSIPIGIISWIWLMLTTILLACPNVSDPVEGITLLNMNYAGVIVGGTFALAMIYWQFIKHKYAGPIPLPIESPKQ